MFQDFWACNASFFGDMPNKKHRNIGLFCIAQQECSALTHLTNAARCTFNFGIK